MAKQDLQHLLLALSRFSDVESAFATDPERVMTEGNLSAEEKGLVRAKDADKIRAYLGDDAAAAMIKFKADD